jgi:hypothetical protein
VQPSGAGIPAPSKLEQPSGTTLRHVARALGDIRTANDTWAPYDVTAHDGAKVEVKSAAHLQSWSQKRYSRITFGIAKTLEWNPITGERGWPKSSSTI